MKKFPQTFVERINKLVKLSMLKNPIIEILNTTEKEIMSRSRKQVEKIFQSKSYDFCSKYIYSLIAMETARLSFNDLYLTFKSYQQILEDNKVPNPNGMLLQIWPLILDHAFKHGQEKAIELLNSIIDKNINTMETVTEETTEDEASICN